MAWQRTGAIATKALLLGLLGSCMAVGAEDSRFAMTHSRSQYVHWINLYDANDQRIDPTDPNAAPYSPVHTCGRCHDYEAIAHGYHFNAMAKLDDVGRSGEPWIWTDTRTGTQIPLSYRGWSGTYDPRDLGISAWDFVLKFGRHMPGGGPGEPTRFLSPPGDVVSARDEDEGSAETADAAATDAADDNVTDDDGDEEAGNEDAEAATEDKANAPPPQDNGRWRLSGQLAVDCMMCHSGAASYSPEIWRDQIAKHNFAWAPAAAAGIADVDGEVSQLPDDFDPSATSDAEDGEASKKKAGLPTTTYRPDQIDKEQKIFFDVVRKPADNVCYYCHSVRVVGPGAAPDWTHDQDVHLRAGMSCSDCHRNGVEHQTVRGHERESHPTGENVVNLSCRGCHLGEQGHEGQFPGGRLGAPKPLHRGLPPLHLERLSCTLCHSGPRPGKQALRLQTAMAHGLGLPTHEMGATTDPLLAAPVLLRTDGEVLYPHRAVWPAFWGQMKDSLVTPLNPEKAHDTLRRTLRVRRNSTFTETLTKVRLSSEDKVATIGEERAKVPETELTAEEKNKLAKLKDTKAMDAFRKKLGEALGELAKIVDSDGAEPVYVSGGRVYRLHDGGEVETISNPAAEPYAWKLAHDVRPARWSSGATSCYECHELGSAIFDGEVTAAGPAPDPVPPSQQMAELAGYDRTMIDSWNLSFQGRVAFKWFGFVVAGIVALILLSFLFLGLNGVFGLFRRA